MENVAVHAIRLDKKNNRLHLEFTGPEKRTFFLNAEYLRVFSPSAEVRGHGVRNRVLQTGKKDVRMVNVNLAGNYSLKIVFDDGHDSGLYTWPYLYELCCHREKYWNRYLEELKQNGASREPDVSIVRIMN